MELGLMLIYSYSSIIHFNVIICSPIVLRPRLEKVVQGHLDTDSRLLCRHTRWSLMSKRDVIK